MNNNYDAIIMTKFNKLKSQYDHGMIKPDQSVFFSDETLKEEEIKNTMDNFNYIIKSKLIEIRDIKYKIDNLEEYRKEIMDILKQVKTTEEKYNDIYQKNKLCMGNLRLESPLFVPLNQTLNAQMRDEPEVIKTDLNFLKYNCLVRSNYLVNMCEICEKIDEKIGIETTKMNIINKYIEVYRTLLNTTFVSDKKISNKYTCTICYENEVKICVTPCGHTFCKSCSERLKTHCFACNTVVKEKTKLFLLGNDDTEEVPINTENDPEPFNNEMNQNIHQPRFERW
jgi:hypothetical protein